MIKTIKRSKEDAMWVPSKNFPRNPMDLYEEMKPYMDGDVVLWRHRASKSPKIGSLKLGEAA